MLGASNVVLIFFVNRAEARIAQLCVYHIENHHKKIFFSLNLTIRLLNFFQLALPVFIESAPVSVCLNNFILKKQANSKIEDQYGEGSMVGRTSRKEEGVNGRCKSLGTSLVFGPAFSRWVLPPYHSQWDFSFPTPLNTQSGCWLGQKSSSKFSSHLSRPFLSPVRPWFP